MAGLENTNHRSVLAKYLSILTVEKTVLNCNSLPTDLGYCVLLYGLRELLDNFENLNKNLISLKVPLTDAFKKMI